MKLLLFTFLCLATVFEFGLAIDFPIANVIQNSTTIHKCNAFFVTKTHLVSTANCVMCNENCKFQIRTGTKSIIDEGPIYEVESIRIHPDYVKNPDMNNVAVLKLKHPAKYSVIYKLTDYKDLLPGRRGKFYLWHFTDKINEYFLTEQRGMNVLENIFSAATYTDLHAYEIGIRSDSPVSVGNYDEGSPFIVNGTSNEADKYVLGFFASPRLQSPGKYYALISVPYHKKFIQKAISSNKLNY